MELVTAIEIVLREEYCGVISSDYEVAVKLVVDYLEKTYHNLKNSKLHEFVDAKTTNYSDDVDKQDSLLEKQYVEVDELLHRISDLRVSRLDFEECYSKKQEMLLLKIIESANTIIDEVVNVVSDLSSNDQFTVTIAREVSNE